MFPPGAPFFTEYGSDRRIGLRSGKARLRPRGCFRENDRRDAARAQSALSADGGAARRGVAARRGLAVRAEVGRLSGRARERRGRARALVAERAATLALLPGAESARPAASSPLRA